MNIDISLTNMDLALIFLVIWGPIFIAFIVYQRIKKNRAINSQGWNYNEGKQPALFNVDIVFENGNSKWHVPAKEQAWAKSIDNPIKKYRKAEAL